MPYQSAVQRRAMHAKAARGEISKKVINEFDRASKGLKLPERLAHRAEGHAKVKGK
jgi:hypothetical protein